MNREPSMPGVLMVVGDSFPPMPTPGAMRMAKFARYLPQRGWRPVVVATEQPYEFEARLPVPEHPDIHLTRVRQIDPVKRTFFFKQRTRVTRGDREALSPSARVLAALKRRYPHWVYPDRDWLWTPMAVPVATRLATERSLDIQVIFSSALTITCHRVALSVARRTGLPWVAEFRDFWAFSTLRPARPRWRIALETRLERTICRRAEALVTISDVYADRLASTYDVPRERVHAIPNGYDPDDFRDIVAPERFERFSIAHAGSFYGGGRDPSTLLQALRRLIDRGLIAPETVSLEFYGPRCPTTHDVVRRYGLEGVVRWRGFIDFSSLVPRLAEQYLLFVLAHPIDDTLTSKVFDYVGCRRPVLAIAPPGGSLERFVRSSGLGDAIAHGDVAGAAEVLERRWRAWRRGEPAVPTLDPDALTEHQRPRHAARLADVLHRAVANPGGMR